MADLDFEDLPNPTGEFKIVGFVTTNPGDEKTVKAKNLPVSTATQTALDAKAAAATLTSHTSNTSNPHSVTKSQVGLGSADNTSDADKPVSTAQAAAIAVKANSSDVATSLAGKANTSHTHVASSITDFPESARAQVEAMLTAGANITLTPSGAGPTRQIAISASLSGGGGGDMFGANNLSELTNTATARTNLGIGNVNNTSDANKPISTATQTALDTKLATNGNGSALTGLTKSQVSLSNVDNTSDANKPVSTATQTALDLKANLSLVGANSGIASLDSSGKIPAAQIPDIAISDYLGNSASQAAMLALTGQKGDWTTRTDTGAVWIISGTDPTQLSSWTAISYPTAPVLSVAGKTGTVTLVKADVGLSSVDNTADTAKPVSTAQQTALDLKAPINDPTFTGNVGGITKSMVGLGSVDNTADTAKPVSTAQAAADAAVQAAAIQRSNHTGTQAASTISDFNTAADARIAAAVINALSDVVISSPSTGQVLKYNGTNWVNDTDSTGGGGGAGSKTFAMLGAWNAEPPAADFAVPDTRNSVASLDFPDDADKSIRWKMIMPEGVVLTSGIKVRFTMRGESATSGNVRWRLRWEKCTTDIDSDSFDATNTQATAAANGTSGIATVVEITCTAIDSIAVGDEYRFELTRLAGTDTTNDTMTGDAQVGTVELQSAA